MSRANWGSQIFSTTARLSSILYPSCLWRIDTNDKRVFLTFDDGPDPESTPIVLDLLDKYDAKASFFLLGKKVDQHPFLAKAISNRGHAIGNHSYYHRDPWKSKKEDLISSFVKSELSILNHGTPTLNLIRPPFGHITSGLRKWASDREQHLVMWDVDPRDYKRNAQSEAIHRGVISKVRRGSIVLLHDRPDLVSQTANALDHILKHLSSEGWSFSSIEASHLGDS